MKKLQGRSVLTHMQLKNWEFYTSVLYIFYTVSEMLHICCIYHICKDSDTLLLLTPVTTHSSICIIMEEKKKNWRQKATTMLACNSSGNFKNSLTQMATRCNANNMNECMTQVLPLSTNITVNKPVLHMGSVRLSFSSTDSLQFEGCCCFP
jgi:hypothetical protein